MIPHLSGWGAGLWSIYYESFTGDLGPWEKQKYPILLGNVCQLLLNTLIDDVHPTKRSMT